ncbi:MAG: short-chain alcohol dehydrogenase [Planctomycetota bacterium]|nr:short-chain alcohol dehydrogenase [Planctomycetota bacterium]
MSSPYQTALVTGAGSGMGRAIAEMLARTGLSVALVGRDRAKLEAVKAGLDPVAAARVTVEPGDVADRETLGAIVARTLKAFGSIDVLVCNAGMNVRKRKLDVLDPADWDAMIATNLTGAYNLVHFALPSMIERKKGLVIQICSISGVRASLLGGVGYSASKFGQAALGLGLGREVHDLGIRSTVIYPGEVNTPILENRPVKVSDERKAAILQPEDVASAVKFLVELPERANVPELVITPTVDEFF